MVGFLVIDSRIAARNLMRNKGRTLVSVLTVATGIIAFLLAGGFIEWVFESMREATIRWQLGHIQVVKPDYMKKGIAQRADARLSSDCRDRHNCLSAGRRIHRMGIRKHARGYDPLATGPHPGREA